MSGKIRSSPSICSLVCLAASQLAVAGVLIWQHCAYRLYETRSSEIVQKQQYMNKATQELLTHYNRMSHENEDMRSLLKESETVLSTLDKQSQQGIEKLAELQKNHSDLKVAHESLFEDLIEQKRDSVYLKRENRELKLKLHLYEAQKQLSEK